MALSTLWAYLFSDSSLSNGQRFLLIGIADSSGFSTSGQTARWEEDVYDSGGHWTGGGAQTWSFSKLKNPPAYIKTSLGPSECGCLFDSKYYTDTAQIPYANSYGRKEYYITLGGTHASTFANYPLYRPIWSFSIPNNKMTAGTASSFSITNSKWYSLLRFEFIATYNGSTYTLGSSNNYQITSLPITFDVEDAALAIPNATSFIPTVSMRVYRRNDDNTEDLGLLYTQGGVNPTVSLPESVRPTISTVTPSDTKGYRTKFGVYVQGKSILAATTVASGIYNSTITKVDYVIDNKTGSTTDLSLVKTIGLLEQSGSRTLTTTVTDSRGRTGVKNLAITVTPYVNPSLTVQANRWNTETAQESDGSTTIRLVCSGQIPSINNVLVTGTLTVQGRQKGVAAWTTIGTASVSGTFEEIFTKTNQSLDYSYEYQTILTDEFGTTITQLSEVGTATPVLEFHASGKGMGIGTVAPENGLAIELPITGSGLYPVGSVIIRYDHISPASLYGGVWERIEGRFLYATGASGTIGATGGSGTHTLTVDEMPAHRHGWVGVNSGTTVTAQMGQYPFDIEQDKKYNWNGTSSMIQNTGGGKAHNNNPAFINVSVWRRVE